MTADSLRLTPIGRETLEAMRKGSPALDALLHEYDLMAERLRAMPPRDRNQGIGYVYERLRDIKDEAERAMGEIDAATQEPQAAVDMTRREYRRSLGLPESAADPDTTALVAEIDDCLANVPGRCYVPAHVRKTLLRARDRIVEQVGTITNKENVRLAAYDRIDRLEAALREIRALRSTRTHSEFLQARDLADHALEGER